MSKSLLGDMGKTYISGMGALIYSVIRAISILYIIEAALPCCLLDCFLGRSTQCCCPPLLLAVPDIG
jgi:hypothetical protein